METKELKQENTELRRAKEILKAAHLIQPATPAIVTFIAEHKECGDGEVRWSVESVCVALTEREVKIAPSTSYDAPGSQRRCGSCRMSGGNPSSRRPRRNSKDG